MYPCTCVLPMCTILHIMHVSMYMCTSNVYYMYITYNVCIHVHVYFQCALYYMYMYISMYMCTSNMHYITYNVCIHVHVYFQCVLCINTSIGKICQCSCSKVWTSTKINQTLFSHSFLM